MKGLPAYVEVTEEPRHRELIRVGAVRIYRVCLPPGEATLYHRHSVDTCYVIVNGGSFRSDEPGQRSISRVGRSTPRITQANWWLRRKFGLGWLNPPGGTVIIQQHARRPLTHRVIASAHNSDPVLMLGVELQRPRMNPATIVGGQLSRRVNFLRRNPDRRTTWWYGDAPEGVSVEEQYSDERAGFYTVRMRPGAKLALDSSSMKVLLTSLEGGAEVTGWTMLRESSPSGYAASDGYSPGSASSSASTSSLKVQRLHAGDSAWRRGDNDGGAPTRTGESVITAADHGAKLSLVLIG